MSKIEKFAQELSYWQKLVKEPLNVKRRISETFSDTYASQMDKLRSIDDDLRSISDNLKVDLKGAKDSLRAGRFIDVAHFVGNINDALRQFESRHKDIVGEPEKYYREFYSGTEHADLGRDYFGKKAGLWDDTKRKITQWQMEKMYRATFKERKAQVTVLVNEAASLVNFTLSVLKELGDYRASGNVEAYSKRLKNVVDRHKNFEKSFKQKYEKYIQPLVEYAKSQQSAETPPAGAQSAPVASSPASAPVAPSTEPIATEEEANERLESNLPKA